MLAQADLEHATLDHDTRRLVLDQLPAMRDSLVNACRDGDWDPQIRTCMMEATDHTAFEDCERTLTRAQREVLERGASGER